MPGPMTRSGDPMAQTSTGWRSAPPTPDDVRLCRWWWVRSPGRDPYPLDCEHYDAVLWASRGLAVRREFAPCMPPGEIARWGARLCADSRGT